MAKSVVATTALVVVVALAATEINNANAFQPSQRAFPPSAKKTKFVSSRCRAASFCRTSALDNDHCSGRSLCLMSWKTCSDDSSPTLSQMQSNKSSLFKSSIQKLRFSKASSAIQKLRRTLTLALASLAFFLASTHVHSPPAHASTLAASQSTTVSWTQKLNPFRTRTADEMIDAYVRDRLFADDEFDPVESAYREAVADAGQVGDGSSVSASSGVYPSLLAETAAAALGRKDVSSLVSPRSTGDGVAALGGKGDGITAVLIRTSDFLQKKLGVSVSVSYYIIAAVGILSLCVLPGSLGVLYQGIQRWQIDKSEMKLYGKITE